MVAPRHALLFLGVSLCATLGLAACTQPPSSPTDPTTSAAKTTSSPTTPALDGVTVSNLVDEDSKSEIRAALLVAGVSTESADRFFTQVDLYNNTVAQGSLLPSGFRPYSADYVADYPLAAMSDLWNQRFPEFIGTNCRINTFLLTHDIVPLNSQHTTPDNSMLFMDEDAIAHAPTQLLSTAELEAFQQLFGRIETTSEHDPIQHVADIEQHFRNLGITFTHPDIKVVSVFIHDTLDTSAHLFIGHIGIAVPYGDGVLFVEKLAFDKPYQALTFRDYDQLNAYLRFLYDDGPDQEYSQPVIFSNNHVLSTP